MNDLIIRLIQTNQREIMKPLSVTTEKVIASLTIKDGCNNKEVLTIKPLEDGNIVYSLRGKTSRIAFSLSNLQCDLPHIHFPHRSNTNLIMAVKKAVNAGVKHVVDVEQYFK